MYGILALGICPPLNIEQNPKNNKYRHIHTAPSLPQKYWMWELQSNTAHKGLHTACSAAGASIVTYSIQITNTVFPWNHTLARFYFKLHLKYMYPSARP